MKKSLVLLLAVVGILSCSNQKSGFVYDIPVLIEKNFDDISTILSKDKACTAFNREEPTSLILKTFGNEWVNSFSKDAYTLDINFDYKSRVVQNIFLSTNDPSGTTNDFNKLLRAGNLIMNNTKYKCEFYNSLAKYYSSTPTDKGRYTGILVTKLK